MENHHTYRLAAAAFAFAAIAAAALYLFIPAKMPILLFVCGMAGMACFYGMAAVSPLELEKILQWAMYAFIASTFLNQSFFRIHIGFFTIFLYRLLFIVVMALFAAYVWKSRQLPQKWGPFPLKGITIFLLAWFLYGLMSLLWAPSVLAGVKYMLLLGMGMMFVLLATVVMKDIAGTLRFYQIWLGMAAVLVGIGLANHFAHIQLPSSTLYGGPAYKLSYPTAVFTNQNDFAAFLSISFFLYLAAAKSGKIIYSKFAALVMSALCIYLIDLTESRASLLGVFAGLAFYGFILLPARFKKWCAMIACFIVVFAVPLLTGRAASVFQNLYAAAVQAGGPGPLPSNLERLRLLINTFHNLADTYGFGVGAGNMPYYLKYHATLDTHGVYEVHNWFAEILGNFGVFPALGYAGMYAYLLYSLYRLYPSARSREQKMMVEGCMAALAAFLFASISPSSVSNLYFHWVLLGLAAAVVSVSKVAAREARACQNVSLQGESDGRRVEKAVSN
ncbi:teichuronic acid biosynthesis protein TuaE [Weizmannia acidilactici]|uniref:Teichuronic acid biosynthesis protein TuaE n=1 Tax=Weizmannia acidilactici TaxID=2607726 RepID=A0A5J4JDV7_9BACI|nr:O-antigen ligase family protein [Weizmannia acidilactici]GER68707.1 teichuronic acid biosynthesis protein TuaE [Weizmannia acidilactici]